MRYDKSGTTRRNLLVGAACLGLVSTYRVFATPTAHTPPPPAPTRPPKPDGSAADAHSTETYRLRPLAGNARMPPAKRPGRRPAVLRKQAHLTLSLPGRHLALTFDDGPHPVHTPAILRVLRRYGTTATFFVIGENASWNPDLVKAIEADGHLVANHSWSHPQLDKLERSRVRKELGRTSDLVEKALGSAPRFARAPYGAWHGPSLKVCAELGMEPMGWSVDTLDWKSPGVATIRTRVLGGARPGAIVLAHDGGGNRAQTVTALSQYLPRLLDQGYSLVPLAEPV